MPVNGERLFPQALIADDAEQPIADGLQRHQAVGPNGERHGAVIGFAAPPCAHKHTGTIEQHRPLSQTMRGKTRVLSQIVEQLIERSACGHACEAVDGVVHGTGIEAAESTQRKQHVSDV